MGYAIVIDVSVARAAGTSGKPVPSACRRALEVLRDSGHSVAMSKDVYDEWNKSTIGSSGQPRIYTSLIAIQWLKDMRSSGRINDIILEKDSALRKHCLQELKNDAKTFTSVEPIAKDFHLVETALASDKRVLSIDAKMFKHLKHLERIANEVCQIMWVNPVSDATEGWLKNNAVDTSEYHVCNHNE